MWRCIVVKTFLIFGIHFFKSVGDASEKKDYMCKIEINTFSFYKNNFIQCIENITFYQIPSFIDFSHLRRWDAGKISPLPDRWHAQYIYNDQKVRWELS